MGYNLSPLKMMVFVSLRGFPLGEFGLEGLVEGLES